MAYQRSSVAAPDALAALPTLTESLFSATVEELKWYATLLPGKVPTRKADLVDALLAALTDPGTLQRLWGQLTPSQRDVVAEVVHHGGGRYAADVIAAKYPGVTPPRSPRGSYGYSYFSSFQRPAATAFDLFFAHDYDLGTFVPSDLALALRGVAPPPPPTRLATRDDPPVELDAAVVKRLGVQPDVTVTENERAAFHDLTATLILIQEGKVAVGPKTGLPSLGSVRQLRDRLLLGDYLPDEYERADDAIRPFALIAIVQAAKWAAPGGAGNKLALTKAGAALLSRGAIGAREVRHAWESWRKGGQLDELSRVRAIKGQGAKATRLTKPAERRAKVAAVLRAAPPERWVELRAFFRFMRAERQSPEIERNEYTALYVGWSAEYGSLGYSGGDYWDVVIGSYIRALLWEYAATLGLIEIAYTRPEESPRDFGELYGMDDEPYLSRYDGLLGLRLTRLGAFALGLADEYTPPPPAAAEGRPVLTILPNLDLVVTDARRLVPNDRAFLERIGSVQSQDVYRLSRERILEAIENGLDLGQVRDFLAAKGGLAEGEFPQTVRTFFADLARRLGAVRDAGRTLVLESDDPLILTELAHEASLRGVVRLGTVGDRTVLLVPEVQESQVRRQLRRLGYVPRRG